MGAPLSDSHISFNSSMLSPEHAHLTEPQRSLSEAQIHEMLKNFTGDLNDPQFDLLRRPAWRGLMMALYVTVILVGMIGNCIVVFVVCRNRKMQNVTNIFIANLALSDILLCVFCLPIQLHYQLTDNWELGEAMCKLIFTAFAVPVYGSVFTILLIAFDRYWLIVYPLRERMSKQTAFILCGLNFLICFVLSLPLAIYARLLLHKDDELKIYRKYCVEIWPSIPARTTFSVCVFLFQFCFPLLIAALLYFKIYRRLQLRPSQRIIHNERKQKTNKILGAIVTIFTICWLPWNLHSLVTEIEVTVTKGYHFKFVDMLLKLFAMSSACVNPFLYCWLNENFRKELDTMAIRLHIYREPSLRRSHRGNQAMPQFQIQPMMEENGCAIGDATATDACGPFLTVDSSRLSTSRLSTTRLSTTRISASNIMEIEHSSMQPSNVMEIEHSMIHVHDIQNDTSLAPSNCTFNQVKAPTFGNTLMVPVPWNFMSYMSGLCRFDHNDQTYHSHTFSTIKHTMLCVIYLQNLKSFYCHIA